MITLDMLKKGLKNINDLVNISDVKMIVKELEDANNKIIELEGQVKELEQQVNGESDLTKKWGSVYSDGKGGKYCVRCYELEHKRVPLGCNRVAGKQFYECPECNYKGSY
ncbi:MAG: hypothetical protein ACRCVJ_17755 [Clostridium sp.]|uniref:hypothetical protein n=1 Tax=Clostridium sp. TaxID=1506 RepID=UPI003F40C52B